MLQLKKTILPLILSLCNSTEHFYEQNYTKAVNFWQSFDWNPTLVVKNKNWKLIIICVSMLVCKFSRNFFCFLCPPYHWQFSNENNSFHINNAVFFQLIHNSVNMLSWFITESFFRPNKKKLSCVLLIMLKEDVIRLQGNLILCNCIVCHMPD